LGFDTLLALYGLRAGESPTGLHPLLEQALAKLKIRVPDDIRRSVVFPELPGHASLPPLELACEARGRLYGVCVAAGEQILQRIGEIERLALSLENLNPRISVYCPSVYCPSSLQRRRLRGAGLEALSDRTLRGWVQLRTAPPPGHALDCETLAPAGPAALIQGGGGDGEPLLVWMGADPTATLNSIWTHRPRQLVLLYDRQTPVIVEKVNRLIECAASVPAGEISLLPSDDLGRYVSRMIREKFPTAGADVGVGR